MMMMNPSALARVSNSAPAADAVPLHPSFWFAVHRPSGTALEYARGTVAEAAAFQSHHPTTTLLQLSPEQVAEMELNETASAFGPNSFELQDALLTMDPYASSFEQQCAALRLNGLSRSIAWPGLRRRERSRLEQHTGRECIVAIDIETVPLAAAMAVDPDPSEFDVASNIKDPAKIAAAQDAKLAKWRQNRQKECSLDPKLGRVAVISLAVHGDSPCPILIKTEEDEADVLRAFWQYMLIPDMVVTFNGQSFDIPFLVQRSLLLGVQIPGSVRQWLKRYTVHPHFDVRAALTNWNSMQRGTLDDWCEAFGLPTKHDGLTGADVAGLVERGEWERLSTYAAGDALNTLLLADHVGTFYVPDHDSRS